MATNGKLLHNPRGRRSSVEKAPTGITGLDEATSGGLPRGRSTLVFGGPGCGKTILALQSLVNGIRRWREPGIFVAFEESGPSIIANSSSFGWELPELQKRKLLFLDAKLKPDTVASGQFELTGMLAGLALRVRQMGAKRIVFDGIDVLLTLLNDASAERGELYRLHEWLRDQRLTGIITAKAGGTDPFSEAHYGFAAYMADCALLLARRNQDAVSERDLSILKYRGSAFSENRLPFLIGPSGLEVASQNPIGDSHPAARERLSSGVSRLDVMLTGGYFRSSSTLITGVPGTAKSSLAGAFVDAACRRQERALYVSFDERSEETVRNLSSIGLKLQPHIDSGHLRMMSALSLSDSAETQLLRIRAAIREHRATCVAIDPISAFANASSQSMAIGVLARFIHWARTNRITLVCTSLLSSADPQQEAADLGVSTLSDTWIHLAYTQRGGERNRSLTIVKSRGTAHSNQVREVILSKKGIALADVYEVGGEVFMGTLRWEKENTRRDEDLRLKDEAHRARVILEHAHAELEARGKVLASQVELNQLELLDAKRVEIERVTRALDRQKELMRHRRSDESESGATRARNLGPKARRGARPSAR